jgi:aspartyl-tRNA(Asn)/glutamyl-tRNA(Gln) amidotransferase subunit A
MMTNPFALLEADPVAARGELSMPPGRPVGPSRLPAGRLAGPLHGVPVGLKDLLFVRGLPNTCGTALYDYWTAGEDCTVARRLAAAGAIVLGKLTMSELAMGTFGANAVQGTPRNPPRRTAVSRAARRSHQGASPRRASAWPSSTWTGNGAKLSGELGGVPVQADVVRTVYLRALDLTRR